MDKILKLNDKEVLINYYEGFKEKAVITFPINENNLDFLDIVNLFKNSDIEELNFYNLEIDKDGNKVYSLQGSLKGYTKLISYNNNGESHIGTINLRKPSKQEDEITAIEMALCDIYEKIGG